MLFFCVQGALCRLVGWLRVAGGAGTGAGAGVGRAAGKSTGLQVAGAISQCGEGVPAARRVAAVARKLYYV